MKSIQQKINIFDVWSHHAFSCFIENWWMQILNTRNEAEKSEEVFIQCMLNDFSQSSLAYTSDQACSCTHWQTDWLTDAIMSKKKLPLMKPSRNVNAHFIQKRREREREIINNYCYIYNIPDDFEWLVWKIIQGSSPRWCLFNYCLSMMSW